MLWSPFQATPRRYRFDGSKIKQGKGYAIYSSYLSLKLKWAMNIQKSTTHAQLTGITIAANELYDRKITGMYVYRLPTSIISLEHTQTTSSLIL